VLFFSLTNELLIFVCFMGGWLRWLWLSGSLPLTFLLCIYFVCWLSCGK